MAFICAERKTHRGLAMVQAAPAGRSQRKPGLYFEERHVGYLVDRVALKQPCPCMLRFALNYLSTNDPRSCVIHLPPPIIASATDSIAK